MPGEQPVGEGAGARDPKVDRGHDHDQLLGGKDIDFVATSGPAPRVIFLLVTALWPILPVYTDWARHPRRTVMKKPTRRSILILALALVGAVPGCDAWRTVRQCGLQGCPEDRRITAEIQSLLAEHRALMPPNMVYVQTLGGVVYLSGQVATPLQRTEAEDVARQAAGVNRVVNTISLGYRG